MAETKNFFNPDLIARILRLELTARRVVDGFLTGKNRSSRHGFSVEFVEHREYTPGDDLRHLDWKVLGRMDRYYIKRYEEETNITAVILLDASGSMTYGSGAISKFEVGAYAASALSYLLHRQRDAVGLAVFDEDVRAFVPPAAKRTALANIAAKLQGTEPRGKTSFTEVLKRVSHEIPHRALFVLISDFFVPLESFEKGLRLFDHRGHDVIVLQVLDEAERTFPFRQNTLFRGLEDSRELLTEPHRLRKRYLESLERFIEGVKKATLASAYDYQMVTTGGDLEPALAALLSARLRRRPTPTRGHGSAS
ncbi:MAG TPA: DUF58 domain-containing protein [Planctomycetota bacterium]|jgi:uncharacterized protein (DUF58 family)|nr:DUF58 domain-containing protein [Planctomycetota bacterium]